MLNIALITNHPPPFRIPIYRKIASTADVALQAIFCTAREPNRQWELPPLQFDHVFLKERFVQRGSNFIHNNPDVIGALRRAKPDVIITTGFNPTFLYAFAYAQLQSIAHVPMTDGTDTSEQTLSMVHKLVRRIVYARSQAFIAASNGGLRLYRSYGIAPQRCFVSCLCIANEEFECRDDIPKRYDLLFCGRLVQKKNPLFALDVASQVAQRLQRRIRILFVGTGELEESARSKARRMGDWVSADFHGHASQDELPSLYCSARLFLFPSLWDPWGVVANEACAAGLPVIVSPYAGVAGELVIDGENGHVCELDTGRWAQRVCTLLADESRQRRFSLRSREIASRFTFDRAAQGIIDACRHAVGKQQQEKTFHNRDIAR